MCLLDGLVAVKSQIVALGPLRECTQPKKDTALGAESGHTYLSASKQLAAYLFGIWFASGPDFQTPPACLCFTNICLR